MKHNFKVTLILLILFLLAQIIGLVIIKAYSTTELPYGLERPEIEESTSYITIFIVILVATGFAILLSKFAAYRLWKLWFFLSVFFTLSIGFAAFMNQIVAVAAGLILTFLKVFRRSVVVHNFTELFIYGGLAAIFTPLFNMWSIAILLILISIYDYIAVFKTKHMISLAKFQAKMKLFAGLLIPYGKKQAILGGGDIAFPLLFSGVALRFYGMKAFIIPFVVSIALFYLLYIGKKNKFYPAMPFVSAGCFLGWLIVVLV